MSTDPGDGPHFRPLLDQQSEPSDRSELWALYLRERASRDDALRKSWDAKINGIILFATLFSAILATFVIDSYKSLQTDPADKVVSALHIISQQLAASLPNSQCPNGCVSSRDELAAAQAHATAVQVNVLWFISLILSISAAIGAVVVQQSTQDYIIRQLEHRHVYEKDIREQARAHVYFLQGIEKSFLVHALDHIATLLHLSFFLFLAGLIIDLCQIDKTVYYACLAVVAVISFFYAAISFIPAVYPAFPYSTPLTAPLRKTRKLVTRFIFPIVFSAVYWAVIPVVVPIIYLALLISASLADLVYSKYQLLATSLNEHILHRESASRLNANIFRRMATSSIFAEVFNVDGIDQAQTEQLIHFVTVVYPERLLERFGNPQDLWRSKARADASGGKSSLIDQAVFKKTMEMLHFSEENAIMLLVALTRHVISNSPDSKAVVAFMRTSTSLRMLSGIPGRLFNDGDYAMQQRAQLARAYLMSAWHLQIHAHDLAGADPSHDCGDLGIALVMPTVRQAVLRGRTYNPSTSVIGQCVLLLATHSIFMKLQPRYTAGAPMPRFSKEDISAITLFTKAEAEDIPWKFRVWMVQWTRLADADSKASVTSRLDVPLQYLSRFLKAVLPYLESLSEDDMKYVFSTLRRIVPQIRSELWTQAASIPIQHVPSHHIFRQCLESIKYSPEPPETRPAGMAPSDGGSPSVGHSSFLSSPRARREQLLALLAPLEEVLSRDAGDLPDVLSSEFADTVIRSCKRARREAALCNLFLERMTELRLIGRSVGWRNRSVAHMNMPRTPETV